MAERLKAEKVQKAIESRIIGHEDVPPDQLLANPLNFRRHPGHQLEALRGSLRQLGWLKTVLVNRRTGHVVDGHARVEEAMRQGLPTVPVTYVDLSPEEEKLALAVLDPITELANKDPEILGDLLKEVHTEEAGLLALLNILNPDPTANDPYKEWQGMPEYENETDCHRKIVVNFACAADVEAFAALIGATFTDKTKATWYPVRERNDFEAVRVMDGDDGK